MDLHCLEENEFGVPCGRKIEGEYALWFATHIECICQECAEAIQTKDYEEMYARPDR